MDGASKDAAYLTLKFAPEYTAGRPRHPGKLRAPLKTNQKLWVPSNFRVAIDGLDCTRVIRVDSFTVKQSVATDDIGDVRDYLRVPAKVEFPNLKVRLGGSVRRELA